MPAPFKFSEALGCSAMNRREFALLVCGSAAACAQTNRAASPISSSLPQPPQMPSAPFDESRVFTRIGFGSCYVPQFEESEVWRAILAASPQAFLLLGDNVYQTEENGRAELLELRHAYAALAADVPFADVRAAKPVLATWDDHDYGMNDAGGDFPARLESEALFKHVWAIGPNDPRRTRPGVYHHRTAGPHGRRVQLVVLDLRYFRTPATMLGDMQWQWLDQVLGEEADVRIIASSVPLLSRADEGESWHSWPEQRERLVDMLGRAGGAVIISGDSHFGAYYRRDENVAYPLLELTSSSLNFSRSGTAVSPPGPSDTARLGAVYYPANFGMIAVDWEAGRLALKLHNATGELARSETIALRDLHA